ncbi:MtrAB system histidine kinase MtrB [Nesterenkonia ebinurensis]|uniref:MtrAB system histidine kinase MtrB n=1 Tax=Nesterenkonia ebinurensis TaxID=2608252 RepID=UPI001CC48E3F|nr:MtrAB system histidine kinase MtrB [Nesterenkonia ebinurensis]
MAETPKVPLGRRVGRLSKFWARSLMVRAVFFTGVLTLVGSGLIAYFLVEQVTSGLYQERMEQVRSEAMAGLAGERSSYDAIQLSGDESVQVQANDIFEAQGGSSALYRHALLMPLEDADVLPVPVLRTSPDIEPGLTSDELNEAIQVSQGDQVHWQALALPNEDGQSVPAVAFGINIQFPTGPPYGLFFIYDFSSVQENVNFVFQVFLIAVAVILVMNVLIAAWVSRSVVKPVSQAAEVSERIAEGMLDQRLAVVGEDEIARLGVSFNRMASTLQEQITQLANLSQMQQRFVSDVSHELRTPLTTVSMAASMLYESRDEFDPVSQRSTELLHHQVERFQALLADLLEMSRFDAGAAELALSEVDLWALSEDVLTAAAPLAERAGTDLHMVVLEGSSDFIAEVDRRRIDRILRNLVNNAIEHAEGQPVDLVLKSSDAAVALAVRDYGVGMTPEQVSHVFDRFWRADPARARTTGGSGLGLSIATEDTRLHQGSLDAWGQAGQGSCFRLVLPRRQDTAYGASPMPLPPSYGVHQRNKISAEAELTTGEVTYDRVSEQALYKKDGGA